MRKIKIRVWDEKTKQMFNGDDIEVRDDIVASLSYGEIVVHMFDDETGDARELIVLQYTGMKDRNYKEICEGDLVYAESNGYTYVIKFGTYENEHDKEFECLGFYAELVNDGYNCSLNLPSELEVVGNIYQNPVSETDKDEE